MKYLYIFEDGEVKVSAKFSDSERDSCEAGILEVIDISGEIPVTYYEGVWLPLIEV